MYIWNTTEGGPCLLRPSGRNLTIIYINKDGRVSVCPCVCVEDFSIVEKNEDSSSWEAALILVSTYFQNI